MSHGSQLGLLILDFFLITFLVPYLKGMSVRLKKIELGMALLKFKQESINKQQNLIFKKFIKGVYCEDPDQEDKITV